MEDLVYIYSNLQLALSSVAKDSSSSSSPWFAPILSATKGDLGTNGDKGDESSDNRFPLIDEYDAHNSSACTTCDLVYLEFYDVTSMPQG